MGFFYFTLRFFVHLAQLDKKEQEKDYPPDHILIIAKGLFGYGGYLAMVTAAVLFFMAAMCFVTALVSVFFCEAVFRDEDLRLFPHINKLEHVEKIKGVEFKVSVRDAMVNCRSGFTFFDAIDGNEIMAKQTLKKDLRNLRPKNLDKILTQKTVPVLVVKSVEETHSQIRNISRQLISVEPTYPELKPLSEAVMSLRRVLIRLSEHVRQMRIRSVREDIFYAIESNFVEMETSIIKAVALFIKMLLDLSPQCSNLISIWDDIGNYICDQIVTPIQGIWMACGQFSSDCLRLANYRSERASRSMRQQRSTTFRLARSLINKSGWSIGWVLSEQFQAQLLDYTRQLKLSLQHSI